ncbi:helix-turn-helix domain-containing protein [Streptomyces sp. NPDC001108]
MPTFRSDLLRLQRTEAGLSCEQLALLADIAPETVRRAERGRSQPSPRVVRALAAALGSSVDELAPPEARVTLKQLRQRTGRTQKAVALQIGVSTQMVGRVENGVYGVKEPGRWAVAYRVSKARWLKAWAASREAKQQSIRRATTEAPE